MSSTTPNSSNNGGEGGEQGSRGPPNAGRGGISRRAATSNTPTLTTTTISSTTNTARPTSTPSLPSTTITPQDLEERGSQPELRPTSASLTTRHRSTPSPSSIYSSMAADEEATAGAGGPAPGQLWPPQEEGSGAEALRKQAEYEAQSSDTAAAEAAGVASPGRMRRMGEKAREGMRRAMGKGKGKEKG